MGTEFLVFFVPFLPIVLIVALATSFRSRASKKHLFIYAPVILVSAAAVLDSFAQENPVRELAVYGFLLFLALIPYGFVGWLVLGAGKRVKDSQWSRSHDR